MDAANTWGSPRSEVHFDLNVDATQNRMVILVTVVVWLRGRAAAQQRGPDTPLPGWQQELLARRRGARASIHRSAFPESDGVRAAGAGIALEPSRRRVIVGMTTTPTRLPHIEPAVRSMLNQTQRPVVVLNVPKLYNDRRNHWKGARAPELPPWLAAIDAEAQTRKGRCPPCVLVHVVDDDWGPATKLVGTALALRDGLLGRIPGDADDFDVVVAADDDHEWEPYALATLVRHAYDAPSAAPTTKAVWSYHTYPYPRRADAESKVCVAQAGDLLAAPASWLDGLADPWGRELLAGGRLASCFFVDDLFFAAFFRVAHGARVYVHPWRYWLFQEVKRRRRATGDPLTPCKGACSPVTVRLRYPDALAMGPVRETHSRNCRDELAALGWWPPARGDEEKNAPCLEG